MGFIPGLIAGWKEGAAGQAKLQEIRVEDGAGLSRGPGLGLEKPG